VRAKVKEIVPEYTFPDDASARSEPDYTLPLDQGSFGIVTAFSRRAD